MSYLLIVSFDEGAADVDGYLAAVLGSIQISAVATALANPHDERTAYAVESRVLALLELRVTEVSVDRRLVVSVLEERTAAIHEPRICELLEVRIATLRETREVAAR